MKTREEIEEKYRAPFPYYPEGSKEAIQPKIVPIEIELLLDIRDLLTRQTPKGIDI